MADQERRAFQRLKLAKPLLASLDGRSALILDVGVGGAFVEHRGRAVPGLKVKLAFKWQGMDLTFNAAVVRSSLVSEEPQQGPTSHSALEFTSPVGDSDERLEKMMIALVGQLLEAHRANASAENAPAAGLLQHVGAARRARSPGLIAYHWNGKAWTKARTKMASQPADGFTVAGHEDEEEIAKLCEAYENADAEGRRLIRLVAELGVRSAEAKKV